MKYFFNTLSIFLIFNTSIFANKELILKAEKSYNNKQYADAARCYETIIQNGYSSYKLYFNLGNAYFKQNKIGKAIFCYEMANKLEPNNEEINHNLNIAQEKTIDKIESKENFIYQLFKNHVVNLMSTKVWMWLNVLFLLASCITFICFKIFQKLKLQKFFLFTSFSCFFLFLITLGLGYIASVNKTKIKFAIITVSETKVYEEPTNTAASKYNLHDGTKVRLLNSNMHWTNIKLENGNEGWVKTADIDSF